jgi:hypothetical protein
LVLVTLVLKTWIESRVQPQTDPLIPPFSHVKTGAAPSRPTKDT